MAVTFQDFEREGVMGTPTASRIKGARAVGDGANAVVVRPAVKVGGPYGMQRIPANLPGGGSITLASRPQCGHGGDLITPPPGAAARPSEVLVVEVLDQAVIGLVWLGMGILLFGALLGIARAWPCASNPPPSPPRRPRAPPSSGCCSRWLQGWR